LQNPVRPQVEAGSAEQSPSGSLPPAGTGEQVPARPATAQDWQLPVQAALQQIPREQKPVVHSAGAEQAAPFGFSPHEPSEQTAGAAQSASAVHEDRHAAGPHRKGKQDVGAGVRQVPAPSQVEVIVKVVVPVGQLAALQAVPGG
jgi:hypothetical protein